MTARQGTTGAAAALLVAVAALALAAAPPARACLPAPFLYVTFHGGKSDGVNQVQRFSRDGCSLGGVLGAGGGLPLKLRELRGVLPLPGGLLAVANAYKKSSAVLLFGECTADNSTRAFAGVLADTKAVPSLVHPYKVTLAPSAVAGAAAAAAVPPLLVTSQDTNTLTLLPSGDVAFELPHPSDEGIRGAVYCGGRVYAGDAESGGLYVLQPGAGGGAPFRRLAWVSLGGDGTGVADLLCDESRGRVLASVRGSPTLGTGVAAVAVGSDQASLAFSTPAVAHPAGLALDDASRTLFVGAHDARNVYAYPADTSGARGVPVMPAPLDDDVELVALSPC